MKPAPMGPRLKRGGFPPAYFRAKFESECHGCGELILKGDLIQYDREDHVLHAPTCLEIRQLRRVTRWDGIDEAEMGF